MGTDCWNVLLVTNKEQDYLLIRDLLSESRRQKFHLDWWSPEPGATVEKILPETCTAEVLLLAETDYSLSLEQLNKITENGRCGAPVLLITNLPDSEQGPVAIPASAVDILDFQELSPAILERAIAYAREKQQMEQIQEQRIQQRTQELRDVLENLQIEIEERKRVEAELRNNSEALQKSTDALRKAEEDRRIVNEELEARVAERTRALAEEQNWLRTLIESAPTGIIFVDGEGNFILTNPETSLIFDGGITGTAYGPQGSYTLHHPDGKPLLSAELPLLKAIQGSTSRNVEMLVRNKNGREVFCLVNSSPVYGPDGKISGAMAVLQDISELKQVEMESQRLLTELKTAKQVTEHAALEARHAAREARTSSTRLEAIINSLTDAVFVYDQDGTVQLANSFAIAILGFDPIHMPRATLMRRIKVTSRDGSPIEEGDSPFNRADRGELVFHDPIRLTNARDRSYELLSSTLPFYIGRERKGVVVVWTDVTRLERLQEEIRQKSLDLQAEQIEHSTQVEVQRQLIRQREMERIQIARDLHDGLLQNLIALNYSLVEAMGTNSKADRLFKLHQLQNALTQEIRDLRTYCNDLRPPVLAPFGLEKAIRSHLEALKDRYPALNIQDQLMHDGKRLTEETRMALFRIYQELINNVIRHAQATDVLVELILDEKLLTLKISDNGVGFEIPYNWIDNARRGHLGIIGARERIESIGGRLDLDSQPGSGARVTVQLPLNNQSI